MVSECSGLSQSFMVQGLCPIKLGKLSSEHFSPNWEILLSYNHLKIISAEDLSQDTYDHEHLNIQTCH